MSSLAHAIRNQLAVAVANLEAIRDGVLEPTPARLTVVLDALRRIETLLPELPRDEPPR